MMRKFFLGCALFVLVACSAAQQEIRISPQKQVQKADAYFATKKYYKASEIYEKIIFESKGDAVMSHAQYQLANCYYLDKRFEDAIFEYDEFLRLFPFSLQAEEASFRRLNSWFYLSEVAGYDQTETMKALDLIDSFLKEYPTTDHRDACNNIREKCHLKLLQKKLVNAQVYYSKGYNNAALLYLQEIFDENMTAEVDQRALFLAAKIYYRKNQKDDLKKILLTIRMKYPDYSQIERISTWLNEE